MAEVTVQIAGRRYRLGCGEGEEEGLIAYADAMDQIATHIQSGINQPVPEGRHMVMVGMTLADELAAEQKNVKALEKQLQQMQQQLDTRAMPSDMFNDELEAAMAERIHSVAERIEHMASKID